MPATPEPTALPAPSGTLSVRTEIQTAARPVTSARASVATVTTVNPGARTSPRGRGRG